MWEKVVKAAGTFNQVTGPGGNWAQIEVPAGLFTKQDRIRCRPTGLVGGQRNANADMSSVAYLRYQDGTKYSDTIYVTSSGDGERSLCTNPMIDVNYRPYILTLNTPPTPDELTLFPVPAGIDVGTNTAQNFISTFIHSNGDQYFYFSTDSLLAKIYVNIKHNGAWIYPNSIVALDYDNNDGSVACMDVIHHYSPVFYNKYDGTYYNYVMYVVDQTGGWFTGFTAGVLSLAFSNNGINWVGPYTANAPSAYNCTEGVCLEHGGVIFVGTTLYIIACEGCFSVLTPEAMTGPSTLTYLYTAPASDPTTVTAYNNKAPISGNGIFRPNLPGYTNSKIFINARLSFKEGIMYLSRSYAYPVDYSGTNAIPCGSLGDGCITGLATLDIRVQMYSMDLGVPTDMNRLYTGTWTLLGDYGYKHGYRSIN